MIRRPVLRRGARLLPLLTGALAGGCAPTLPSIRQPATAEALAPASPEPPSPAAGPEPTGPEGSMPEPPAAEAPREEAARAELRRLILETARAMLGRRSRLDCSGYVLAAYAGAGLTVELPPALNRSRALLVAGREVATPEPGDLAFFRDTYDRNRNGKPDDGITHVALVEAVDGSSLTLLHRGLRRVERLQMNLERPWDRDLNDQLRVRRPRDPGQTRYLAGELFVSFGALLDGPVTQSFQARRAEDTGSGHPGERWQSATIPEPAPSRSTRRRSRSPSRSDGCSGSCPPTRRSSSPSSASDDPGAPSSPAP